MLNVGTGEIKDVPFKCNSWSCPVCGPKKQKKLINDIAVAGEEYDMRTFFTLTLPGEWHKGGKHRESEWNGKSSEEAHIYIKACWSKLRKRLARKIEGFKFFVVVENHKDGTPHIHGILSGDITRDELRSCAQAVGLGKMVDVQQAPIVNIARYVSKYMGKEADKMPKGFRRYAHSKGIVWHPTKDASWTGYLTNEEGLRLFPPVEDKRDRYAAIDSGVHGDLWRLLEQKSLLRKLRHTDIMKEKEEHHMYVQAGIWADSPF